jgi:hypothetical protein
MDILANNTPLEVILVPIPFASKSANCVFKDCVIRNNLSARVFKNTVEDGQQQALLEEEPITLVTEDRDGFVIPEEVSVVSIDPENRDTIIESAEIFFLVVSIKCLLVPLVQLTSLVKLTLRTMMYLVPPLGTTLSG